MAEVKPPYEVGRPVERSHAPPPTVGASGRQRSLASWLWRWLLHPDRALLVPTLVLGLGLSIVSPYFLQAQNLINVTQAAAETGVTAAIFTLVMISRGLDLSVTATMAMVGEIVAIGLGNGWSLLAVLAAAVVVSVLIGLGNGLLIAFVGLNPFVTTLGTWFAMGGVVYLISNGQSQQVTNSALLAAGQGSIAGIPNTSIIMVAVFGLVFLMLRHTRFGMHVVAIGSNEEASRRAGVPVAKVKVVLYVLSALSAGLSGLMFVAESGAAVPYSASSSTGLLSIIASVILGGAALTGGRGSVAGTFVGLILLNLVANGLTLLNLSSFYQMIATGVILVLAVTIDRARERGGTRWRSLGAAR